MIYEELLRPSGEGLRLGEVNVQESVGRIQTVSAISALSNNRVCNSVRRTRYYSEIASDTTSHSLSQVTYRDYQRAGLLVVQDTAELVPLGILRTNSLVYEEGIEIFYKQHIHFDCAPRGVLAFFGNAPSQACKNVASLQVHQSQLEGYSISTVQWSKTCNSIHCPLSIKTLHIELTNLERQIFGVPAFVRMSAVVFVESGRAEDCLKDEWAQEMLQIRHLDTIHVGFSGSNRIELQADLAWLLMSKMTRDGPDTSRLELGQRWLCGTGCWIGSQNSTPPR